jgi:hypothetical protein
MHTDKAMLNVRKCCINTKTSDIQTFYTSKSNKFFCYSDKEQIDQRHQLLRVSIHICRLEHLIKPHLSTRALNQSVTPKLIQQQLLKFQHAFAFSHTT